MRFVAPIWVRQAGQSHFDKVKEMSRMKRSILTKGRPDGQFNSGYVAERFSALEDPRTGRAKRHNLIDVVVVAICAVICGADSWVDVEVFGKSKKAWLSRFLGLPDGIPFYDTFGRVFARLDSVQFERCLKEWVGTVNEVMEGQVVAIDGKTVRGSRDGAVAKSAIHMVSA